MAIKKKRSNSEKLDYIISKLNKESRDMSEAISLLTRALQHVVNSTLDKRIELSMEIQSFLRRHR